MDVARARYAPFLHEPLACSGDWRVDIGVHAGGTRPLPDVIVRRSADGTALEAARHDFSASLDLAGRAARVELAEPDDIALDAFLRVAWSLALLDVGGLLIHAASVVRAGGAYLFVGRSGSGKTTLARLCTGATVLSDELSIARLGDGAARCHGTPFWGDLGGPGADGSAPLRAICFLEQAPRHALEPLAPPKALSALLPNVVFFARERGLTGRVFEIAAGLVETVPCFRLRFTPDAGFWEVLPDA